VKTLAVALLLFVSSPVLAEGKEPFIIGSIPNRAGGVIVFTSMSTNCPQGQKRGYTRGDGGKVDFWFCWALFGNEFIVAFDDGDRYTYSFDSLQISPEYREYLSRQSGGVF